METYHKYKMKQLIFLILFAGIQVFSYAQKPLEMVRALPQQAFPETVKAGNYSGITHIKGNQYAVVSDKSPLAGFYLFNIDIDSITGEITNVRMDSLLTSGKPNRDEEGIVYFPNSNTVFVSGESDQRIIEYNLDGSLTDRELNVPQIFSTARRNLSFEALTYNAKTHRFWTSTEGPLPKDGGIATSMRRTKNRIRIQSFDETLQPAGQYAYLMDRPIAKDSAINSQTGVSAMIALDDGRLIVLEREFCFVKGYFGSWINEKLYVVNPLKEKKINSTLALSDVSPYMRKTFLYEWRTDVSLLSYDLANYEGMCLGPKLKDGSQTIILVADSQNQYMGILKDWFKVLVVRME